MRWPLALAPAPCETDSVRASGRVLDLLRKHGHNTTSFQILEPGLHYWFDDDACVAYADTGGAWVVAGAPVAAREREVEVMTRFAEAARAAGKRVRFFGLEDDVSTQSAFACLHVGEQPVWDPQEWGDALRRKRSLREQLRRSRAKGVSVRLVGANELADGHPTRAKIDHMIAHWMNSRAMAPMGFVVHLDPYGLPEERRFFIAERGGLVVGVLIAVPIYARDGWFFEDVLRDPSAPNGTIELLFDHAMRQLADEGSRHVTFGLAPLAGTTHRWMRRIRDHTRWLYDFEGLRSFKAKLQPHSWHPVYLAYPARERGMRAVIDTLEAFARGSFFRFGWRTLVHRAALVTRWLALLLVPWIAIMALAPTRPWFPSRLTQIGWVTYDLLLFVMLQMLASRWSRRLAQGLAAAALFDFTLGSVQLLAHNVLHLAGTAAWLIAGAAVAAPLGVAAFLWSARNRADMYK